MTDTKQSFELGGLIIPNDPTLISPRMERRLKRKNYAQAKLAHLEKVLHPGARLLELGTEIGVASAIAAKTEGVEKVAALEVNPAYEDYITALWTQNGIENATLHIGMPVERAGVKKADFYLRDPLWESSLKPDVDGATESVKLENLPLPKLIEEIDPTVILCTLQGLELPLFDDADLSRVDHLIIEVTPSAYGQDALREFVDMLGVKGFMPAPDTEDGKRMICFERVQNPGSVLAGTSMPRRHFRPNPTENPRILVSTCMKDEGPFILEWLAWQRAVGITDFVVFTNDCTDGTDRLLDRLDELGYLTHLPNPAPAAESHLFLPLSLRYLRYLRQFREADYVLPMDVDEFLNIKVGEGRLQDLFEAVGDFDVLSISEVNHGSNNRLHFKRGWVTEQFPGHQPMRPKKTHAHRGVKSITRLSPRVEAINNHRPSLFENLGTPVWLDGSGRRRTELQEDRSLKGWNCINTFDLISLDHFSIRSLDSFLVKMHRGDAIIANKKVSNRYWRTRNKFGNQNSDLSKFRPYAKAEYERITQDEKLMELHEACCLAHEARIASLVGQEEFEERKIWIFDHAWPSDIPEEYRAIVEARRAERAEQAELAEKEVAEE